MEKEPGPFLYKPLDEKSFLLYTRFILNKSTVPWLPIDPRPLGTPRVIKIAMLDKKVKERIIKKFRTHESDTGSSEVQIAILTEEIKQLTDHLKTHKKDFSSRRGLLKKVGERRRLLRYLERENAESFETLVKRLKLKIAKRFDKNTIAPDIIEGDEPAEEEIAAATPDEE